MSATSTPPGDSPREHPPARQALLDAASALFDERGYQATTVREIGVRAGVDPALIARYFNNKEGLYLAVIALPNDAEIPAEPAALLEALLRRWETRGHSPLSRALVGPALSDAVRETVRTVYGERLVTPVAEGLTERGADQGRLRAELLVAMATGIALARDAGALETLGRAPLEDVIALLTPVAQALGSPG